MAKKKGPNERLPKRRQNKDSEQLNAGFDQDTLNMGRVDQDDSLEVDFSEDIHEFGEELTDTDPDQRQRRKRRNQEPQI